jgi:RimJ/RimL family protein N-acetyltransferase
LFGQDAVVGGEWPVAQADIGGRLVRLRPVSVDDVLNDYAADRDSANFRIALRGPAWYGRSLGTEATRLIVDHGLGTFGLRAITLTVLAVNPRAIRAYEKARFRRTGETIEAGKAWVEMEITADER